MLFCLKFALQTDIFLFFNQASFENLLIYQNIQLYTFQNIFYPQQIFSVPSSTNFSLQFSSLTGSSVCSYCSALILPLARMLLILAYGSFLLL